MNDDEIKKLGVETQVHFWQTMAVEQLKERGVIAVATRLPDPYLNLVVDTQLDELLIKEKISTVVDFFAQHRVPWTWCIGPLSTPTNLNKYLIEHNFLFLERFPSLYIHLNNHCNYEMPKNFTIREVKHESDFTDWIKPISEAFSSLDKGEGFKKLNIKLFESNSSLRHFIGYYQNQPVSSITIFIHNKNIMIHNLATLPKFRNQGFASLLIQYILKISAKMGMQFCFLDTSDVGLSVYQKLGFEIYCYHAVYQLKK